MCFCVFPISLDHPHIIRFIDVYEDSHFLYVIMEKCPGGEVFEKLVKLRRFTESDVIDFCKQMFSAIEYIHSLNIIHRDIKAENFLYANDGSVKLIDFGLAVRLGGDNEILKEVVGSAHYIAPEMLDRRYSKPVDIWSAGVLIFLMLHGRYPFDAETDEGVMKKVKGGGIKWESPDFAPSRDISHFLHCLLERDPLRRPSASVVLTEPFLSGSKTTAMIEDPTASDSRILISAVVIEKLSESVILPARSRRKEQLVSDTESSRSAWIIELDQQYERGTFRGWRRSRRGDMSISAPTSPMNKQKVLGRQATKGLIQGGKGSDKNHSLFEASPGKSPDSKRSRSLPGSFKVSFDPNPPDLYIYTEGTSNLIKVPSRPNSPNNSRRL